MTPKVLIAEDAADIAQVIAFSARLAWPHAEVTIVATGNDALQAAATSAFDLVVLDISMPSPDGLEVCRRMREGGSDSRILMLTVRGSTLDKVRAFDLGADDYLTKPFDPLELQARLRALLRRAPVPEGGASTSFTSGELTINFGAHEVRLGDEIVPLTPTEFRLLAELARHAGSTLPHGILRERVWGQERFGDPSDLKVFIRRLRQKLGDDPEDPRYIETVRGFGYRFLDPA